MKAITTKFLPATNHRGPRVAAFDANSNRIVIDWDDDLDASYNHKAAATALCRKMDWQMPILGGWIKEGSAGFSLGIGTRMRGEVSVP